MRHVVLGAGNLGTDLADELRKKQGILDVCLLSKSNGFDVTDPNQMHAMLTSGIYDCIWYAIGFGSVAEAKKYPDTAHLFHVRIPKAIAALADKNAKLVFFSSDYAADENQPHRPDIINPTPRSSYAFLKAQMEIELQQINRPNTAIIRVGSLYGFKKPTETFPGKIIKNFTDAATFRELPSNVVTPTPTLWLANMLSLHFEKLFSEHNTTMHHCAPRGNATIRDWAILILEKAKVDYKLTNREFFDSERPQFSGLGCSFTKAVHHWHDLFEAYFKPRWYAVQSTQPEGLPLPNANNFPSVFLKAPLN